MYLSSWDFPYKYMCNCSAIIHISICSLCPHVPIPARTHCQPRKSQKHNDIIKSLICTHAFGIVCFHPLNSNILYMCIFSILFPNVLTGRICTTINHSCCSKVRRQKTPQGTTHFLLGVKNVVTRFLGQWKLKNNVMDILVLILNAMILLVF